MLKSTIKLSLATLVLLLGCSRVDPAPQSVASPAPNNQPPKTAVTPASDLLPDTLIVPGERVGPITRTTTRKDLVEQFGEALLADEAVPVGEGMTQPGTAIDLGPERSLKVVWTDSSYTQPAEVRDLGPVWRTEQGIGVGISLADLETQLGEFQLYGFGWDYEGTVLLEGTQLSQYQGLLFLRLRPESDAAKRFPDDYTKVLGDGLFSSSNPHIQVLAPTVYEAVVLLEVETP